MGPGSRGGVPPVALDVGVCVVGDAGACANWGNGLVQMRLKIMGGADGSSSARMYKEYPPSGALLVHFMFHIRHLWGRTSMYPERWVPLSTVVVDGFECGDHPTGKSAARELFRRLDAG